MLTNLRRIYDACIEYGEMGAAEAISFARKACWTLELDGREMDLHKAGFSLKDIWQLVKIS